MLKCASRLGNLSKRAFATAASVTKEKWDLYTSVCLERRPVITPEPTELEKKFKAYLQELEVELSSKSDYEVRHQNDLLYAEKLKEGDIDLDLDVAVRETAQDFFDASKEELTQFKLASRVTEADKKNDITSLERKLDKHLVLLVKQQIGEQDLFLLPQALAEDGKTLRQTAEQILVQSCGPELKVQFYGNGPAGFYKYKYPKPVQEQTNTVGAKIFFYLVRHRSGDLKTKSDEFKWLDRNELRKELTPGYHRAVAQFLIDE